MTPRTPQTTEKTLWALVEALPLTPWRSDFPPSPGPYLTTLQAGLGPTDRPSGYPVWSYWTGTSWGWATPHPAAAEGRLTLLDKPANQAKHWRGLTLSVSLATVEDLYSQLYLPKK